MCNVLHENADRWGHPTVLCAHRAQQGYLFASQALNGAVEMARTLRADGWDVKIRSWDRSVYQTVHA